MRNLLMCLVVSALLAACGNLPSAQSAEQEETVTISGRVTDFDGNPIEGSNVVLVSKEWKSLYETVTDSVGYYELSGVKKNRYIAISTIRDEEYPGENAVPKEDMRLEFWGWNFIADRCMTFDMRYHKLELYGTTVFEQIGGCPAMFVYFRPMSVTRGIAHEDFLDIAKMEAAGYDVSVLPEYLDVEIFADDEPLEIYSVQAVDEYAGEKSRQLGYLAQVARPSKRTDRPYIIFRVVATNREYDEKGENVYFYEPKDYQ